MRIHCGSCTRNCPQSWCRRSHSHHFQWCTRQCLRENKNTQCSTSSSPRNLSTETNGRLTDAVEPVLGRFVTRVTGALIATDHVDTLAVPAQSVTQFTFIDVCRERNPRLRFEAEQQQVTSDGEKHKIHF